MLARITGLSPLSHDAVLAGQINLYLFTDASNTGIGAWLGTGPSPDQAQPIAYDSRSLTSAERNYPVHEKELCAIIHALKEWRPLLLGLPVHVMTDHATLKWFFQQPNLSEHQKRWLLVLANYDLHISHIPGVTNVIADAFSRLHQDAPSINALTMMVLTPNADFVDQVANGYAQDPIMAGWQEGKPASARSSARGGARGVRVSNSTSVRGTAVHSGCIRPPGAVPPRMSRCHGSFWSGKDTRTSALTCPACQTSKAATTKPPGLLHSLPVPAAKFADIGIDFVGPLPTSHGFDYLIVITNRLTGWVALIPTVTTLTSSAFSQLYYDHWVSKYGVLTSIVSDRDKLFTAASWRRLNSLLGTKLKMSTAYHPQTDGISERSNKTVIQTLRAWTDDQGRNWAANLQRVAFAMNNTLCRSTQHTPAKLAQPTATEWELAAKRMELEEGIACDELLLAKHRQSVQANKHRRPGPVYRSGDKVYLNTAEFRHEYKTTTNRSAKFIPRWEGPFTILRAFPEQSLYELDVPITSTQSTPRRHVSRLKPYKESTRYHHDSAPRLLDRPVQAPPRLLQILEDRTLSPKGQHPKVYQVRARFAGEGPKARWISRDEALSYDGWKEAWEEFIGEDELHLDVLDVLDVTADDLQLNTSY
ncbi:hypothetical protein LQV05_005214 [Cryptococcus neoformans]|nr:hypothetical protein LQV05_005214 [Cryptococcus neoformans]